MVEPSLFIVQIIKAEARASSAPDVRVLNPLASACALLLKTNLLFGFCIVLCQAKRSMRATPALMTVRCVRNGTRREPSSSDPSDDVQKHQSIQHPSIFLIRLKL